MLNFSLKNHFPNFYHISINFINLKSQRFLGYERAVGFFTIQGKERIAMQRIYISVSHKILVKSNKHNFTQPTKILIKLINSSQNVNCVHYLHVNFFKSTLDQMKIYKKNIYNNKIKIKIATRIPTINWKLASFLEHLFSSFQSSITCYNNYPLQLNPFF